MLNKGKIILSIGDDGAIISAFKDGKLLKRAFLSTPYSQELKDICNEYPKFSVSLLLDNIDQNYIFSNIPALKSSNVKKIVQRKVENEFDKNDLNDYIFLGKEENSSKKELNYVFISVRNSSPVTDWVEAFSELDNHLEGIYLYPVEAQNFMGKLQKIYAKEKAVEKTKWEILISHNRVGGFRQVVLKDGKITFTRISQSTTLTSPDAVGVNISQEAANTMEYIRRIGFNEDKISIYIVSSDDVEQFIEIPGVSNNEVMVMSPNFIAKKLGYKNAAEEKDKFGDVIFASYFANAKKKLLKFKTPEISSESKLIFANGISTVILYALIAVLPIICLVLLYLGYVNSEKIDSVKSSVSSLKSQASNLKNFEADYGLKPAIMNDIVTINNAAMFKNKKFSEILIAYNTLSETENIALDSYNYKVNDGNYKLNLKLNYNIPNNLNYGDVLFSIKEFERKINEAFKKFEAKISGFDKSKDIKIDLDKEGENNKDNNIEIDVKIEGAVE